jgi:hypothetical protein
VFNYCFHACSTLTTRLIGIQAVPAHRNSPEHTLSRDQNLQYLNIQFLVTELSFVSYHITTFFDVCSNAKLTNIGVKFINYLCEINSSFSLFNHQDCWPCKTEQLYVSSCKYSYDVQIILETHLK